MTRQSWTAFLEERRSDIMTILIVIAFFALCFLPILFQGKYFLLLDAFSEMLPERQVAWSALRHGSVPLWTPLIMSGYPMLSMAQIGLGYPLTWGYLFLPPYWAEQIYVLAPFLLMPLFTYCYARYIGRSYPASLLAGLAYGYGGVLIMPDIHNGLLPNAMLWLPLFLLAIERSRKRQLASSLLLATIPYSMSVLTGIGQGFLFVGMVGLAYALFLVIFAGAKDQEPRKHSFSLTRLRPLLVTIGAIVVSAGVAAFQILETMRAQRRSIRATLTYEMFTDPSPTLWELIKFVIVPKFNSFQDVCTAYVPPLAIILAAVTFYALLRRRVNDSRVVFWMLTAISTWILMLGSNTPLYRILFHIPVLNKFREPPRYAVIWTFAIAVLAGYGFDLLTQLISKRRERAVDNPVDIRREVLITAGILILSLAVGVYWIRVPQEPNGFLVVKAVFTLLIAAALWFSFHAPAHVRSTLSALVIALACFVEPYELIRSWWWPRTKPVTRVTVPTNSTRFLQQFPADQNRVYSFVEIFSEEFNPNPPLDSPNLTMLHGLQNVAGYEPLLLERYSRALGNVWLDSVTTLKGFEPDRNLFQSSSHVLDLLNNTYLLTFSNPALQFENTMDKDGITFAKRSTKIDLLPGKQASFSGMSARADTIAIVSALANSAAHQGDTVATLKLTTISGQVIERELRAGIDTAEWAHDRPDVIDSVGHSLAPVFEVYPGDAQKSFPAYRYWTRISLGSVESIDRIELNNVTNRMILAIDRMTLYDSTASRSTAVSLASGPIDFSKWQPVFDERGVIILRNSRALPRAWLVSEAEAVEEDEALQRIRGWGDHHFNPRQTVLLETKVNELPKLPGGPISPGSSARVVAYEPNRLEIETECSTPSVLVVSEIFYPGWVATIDGQIAPIHTADYLLRAVALPAGTHRVEMRYGAPAARMGTLISGFSLALMLSLGLYARSQRKHLLRP